MKNIIGMNDCQQADVNSTAGPYKKGPETTIPSSLSEFEIANAFAARESDNTILLKCIMKNGYLGTLNLNAYAEEEELLCFFATGSRSTSIEFVNIATVPEQKDSGSKDWPQYILVESHWSDEACLSCHALRLLPFADMEVTLMIKLSPRDFSTQD